MRFTVGYHPLGEGEGGFSHRLLPYLSQVAEVYFAWPDAPSGRPPLAGAVRETMVADLRTLRESGVELNLLFNATCDGAIAGSTILAERIDAILRACAGTCGLPDSMSTTSPAAAHVVRHHHPAIRIRASVNLRLGTLAAMKQVADLFDGYYVQRDVQRDLGHLRRLRAWADANGKSLALLANSGCLRHCATQTWHDNLVAHLGETDGSVPVPGFQPLTCRRHLADPANRQALLQATWIRPEDLHHYEGLVDTVKLATRSHPRPFQVIHAYCNGRHRGNLLDLLEPGLGHVLGRSILDNEAFPDDWLEHAATCLADGACPRCAEILKAVIRPAWVPVGA